MGEDKIVIFGGPVAGKAGFMERLGVRFAVGELRESPSACRGVLF